MADFDDSAASIEVTDTEVVVSLIAFIARAVDVVFEVAALVPDDVDEIVSVVVFAAAADVAEEVVGNLLGVSLRGCLHPRVNTFRAKRFFNLLRKKLMQQNRPKEWND